MSTAISRIYTPEGFVIASDSRKFISTGQSEDGLQKIFAIKDSKIAYALGGTIGIQSEGTITFDLVNEVQRLADELLRGPGMPWAMRISIFTASIKRQLIEVYRQCASGPMPDTEIFINGFWSEEPKSVRVSFHYGDNGCVTGSFVEDTLGPQLSRYGSTVVWELLRENDPRFSSFSLPTRENVANLSTAIQRAHLDILAQSSTQALAVDQELCCNIGGPIHIATITLAQGFKWVPGFEPVAPLNLPGRPPAG